MGNNYLLFNKCLKVVVATVGDPVAALPRFSLYFISQTSLFPNLFPVTVFSGLFYMVFLFPIERLDMPVVCRENLLVSTYDIQCIPKWNFPFLREHPQFGEVWCEPLQTPEALQLCFCHATCFLICFYSFHDFFPPNAHF